MAAFQPIAALAPVGPAAVSPLSASGAGAQAAGFSQMLMDGLRAVDAKVAAADAAVTTYALGGSAPLHQVTLALEEARLAVEMSVQVRTRLIEVYRDFMAMQI